MAEVEQHWFRHVMADEQVPRLYRTNANHNAEFNAAVGDPEIVAEARDTWRAEVAFAERFVAGASDLDLTVSYGDALTEGRSRSGRCSECAGAQVRTERGVSGQVGQYSKTASSSEYVTVVMRQAWAADNTAPEMDSLLDTDLTLICAGRA